MEAPGYALGASLWGFYGRRAPAEWPTLPEAARAILSLDSSLGLEVWASKSLDEEAVDPDEIAALADICRSAPFVAAHARGAYWTWDPTALRREIDFAEQVGATVLVLHPVCLGIERPEDRPDIPEIRRIAAYAAKRGVRLALENMRDTIWLLDRMLEDVGDDPAATNLGICIDVGHAHLSHDAGRHPVTNYLERYAAQLIHVHLHDNDGASDEHLLPGTGSIDWPQALGTLARIDFRGIAMVEVHPPADLPAIDGIRDGVRFVRAAIEGEAREVVGPTDDPMI